MNKDALAGLGLIAIAGAYWLGATAIPQSVLAGEVPADGLPKLLAWGLGGLGALLTAQGLARRARPSIAAAPAEAPPRPWLAHLRALGMLAIGAGYIVLVPYLGYAVAIGLLMAGVALYNGAARSPRLLVIAALGAALFYGLFVHVLKVPLPAGVWPDLIG